MEFVEVMSLYPDKGQISHEPYLINWTLLIVINGY